MSLTYRNKSATWIAAGMLTGLVGLTGCSEEKGIATDERPTTTASSVGSQGQKGEDSGDSSSSQPGASAADQSTAEAAVAEWVTAVIKGQSKDACLLMGEATSESSPAQAASPERCDGTTPEGREIVENVERFRETFTPEPPTDDPKVQVSQVAATGDTVVVPAEQITVDGQTLHKIILSHSTGVEAEQLDVNVESTKIQDAWYVTNLDLNIG
ncbi:hypothetical protein [Streptomyces chartreusis]|uniref:hypothetical protein n=1 Tax=Streptomyces chartreusis TaxID=1969 RepID=UPI002F9100D8|nr:hypothetical protein OG938_46825 [Streptomyces chartreusis]